MLWERGWAVVAVWRWRGCGGGGGGAFLAACALFDVVVDVPVVLVVDVGLSSSWTRLSCPLLCRTGVLVQTVQPRGVPQLQFLDKVVTCPLLRRQVRLGFAEQKTVEVPQLQLVEFFDQVVDILVVAQMQIPLVSHEDSQL